MSSHFRLPARGFLALGLLAAVVGLGVWRQARAPQAGARATQARQAHKSRLQAAYQRLPLSFEANQGQADARVRYLSRGAGYTLFLTGTEAVLGLHNAAKGERALVRMQLAGANPNPKSAGGDRLPGSVNYFLGKDPKQWRTRVPLYDRVRYDEVYPGVDLVYYGTQRQLEYDFLVAPGADPGQIRLRYGGADRVEVSREGDLVLHAGAGEVRHQKPFVYQEVAGRRVQVAGSFVRHGRDEIGFELGKYDETRPLVIDPVLTYASFLGGSGADQGLGIAVDQSGLSLIHI